MLQYEELQDRLGAEGCLSEGGVCPDLCWRAGSVFGANPVEEMSVLMGGTAAIVLVWATKQGGESGRSVGISTDWKA